MNQDALVRELNHQSAQYYLAEARRQLEESLWDAVAQVENFETPPIHYMPCPNHEAAIEVEGYCPCWDGLEIDWTKTDIWRNE